MSLAGRRRVLWLSTRVLALYAAVNVPVARVLSSPLTMPMWRAAGGPLLDSIALLPDAGEPRGDGGRHRSPRSPRPSCWRVYRARWRMPAALVAARAARARSGRRARASTRSVCIATRSPRSSRTMTPRLASRSGQGDWRTSPFSEQSSDDLAAYRGAAAGLNVVLVILESTGAQYLAPYGAADDPTPTSRAWPGDAILFEHAYAVYPESIKGLFATLCARPPAFDVDAETHAQVAVRAADAASRGARLSHGALSLGPVRRISAWRPCSRSSTSTRWPTPATLAATVSPASASTSRPPSSTC